MADEQERVLRTAARYLGVRGEPTPEIRELLLNAYAQLQAVMRPAHALVPGAVEAQGEDGFSFGDAVRAKSRDLCKLVRGCVEGYALVATLGMDVDLRIQRLWVTDQALASAVGACGSAYVDVYIDGVLQAKGRKLAEQGQYLTPRFSPGYGDAPLSMQPDLLRVCGAQRLGVRLTRSLMMIPEKSVSAIVGVTREPARRCLSRCDSCSKTDCPFRQEEENHA